jgi:hypothetical protein
MRSKLSALAVPPVGDADMRGGGLAQPRLNSLVLRLENGQDVGLAEVRMPQGDVGGVDGAAEDLFGWSVTVFGSPSVVAPAKMNMAPIYKLLLKERSIEPCVTCPYHGEM